ncbi:DUF305 domain-containing protein [Mesorhizobium australicum]|uniref:DUF305 domain-containing protein n=1 Tax=Mesorhizobium australicum TaxID=536018 RepID=A0A1X7NCG0_9HYPH|nr:DUF305 domain-containing protein [Mesorhizobium australicum]SMH34921.1 protein of unknown function [Mesorhizobium australicum]
MRAYARFAAMIAVSTVVMYSLTYVNVYQVSHIRWSETRLYMALIMGSAMAVVMLSFMLHMYTVRLANLVILSVAALVFAGSVYLVRSQVFVGDTSWMRAMIPHHSIAILTSERANLTDPRVRDLAARIVEAQRREISEMEKLIDDIERGR